MDQILITGAAGFIGFHLSKKLLENRYNVIGIDNLNSYYSPILKQKRLEILKQYPNFSFKKLDFSSWKQLKAIDFKGNTIVHLGAQAGVRYSLKNPWAYERSNIKGTLNILEYARKKEIEKVIYASSSSVYGNNKKVPFSEKDEVSQPISLYATTKRSNELMAYTYHTLYGIRTIGLRFFTVYGEFGRPDMAYWIFSKKILLGKKIKVYNYGKMSRDFTYIEDVVRGIISTINKNFKYEIFNIGNDNPIELKYFISLLEKYLGKKAHKEYLPMQPGEVEKTWADLTKSKKLLNYSPQVSIEEGLNKFCKWFLNNWNWLKNI